MVTKKDILNYANIWGKAAAADLLLLCGPDGFDGTVGEYHDLMDALLEE